MCAGIIIRNCAVMRTFMWIELVLCKINVLNGIIMVLFDTYIFRVLVSIWRYEEESIVYFAVAVACSMNEVYEHYRRRSIVYISIVQCDLALSCRNVSFRMSHGLNCHICWSVGFQRILKKV